MEYSVCPVCGNEKIIEWVTKEITSFYSKSGKCIKKEIGGIPVCWGWKCKCGWQSPVFTE